MTPFISEQSDPLIDLESGTISTHEPVLSNVQGNTLYTNTGGIRNSFLATNGSITAIGGQIGANLCSNTATEHCESSPVADIQVLIGQSPGEVYGEDVAMLEKRHVKEPRKKAVYKKAPKPPRPPRGPSLDAADLKLVKEISAKRARKERIKAFKKMKEAKSSSSSSSNGWISALVITVLLSLVLLFQGFHSRGSSSMSFQGSPEPAVSSNNWMSVQFYGNPSSANEGSGLGSESPSSSSLQQENSGSELSFPG